MLVSFIFTSFLSFSPLSPLLSLSMSIAPGITKIGWIGTGVMGKSMCSHLIKAGYQANVVCGLSASFLSDSTTQLLFPLSLVQPYFEQMRPSCPTGRYPLPLSSGGRRELRCRLLHRRVRLNVTPRYLAIPLMSRTSPSARRVSSTASRYSPSSSEHPA